MSSGQGQPGHKLWAMDDDEPQMAPPAAPQANKDADEESSQEEVPKDFMAVVKTKVRKAVAQRPAEAPTICEVPEDLAEGNKGAYTPKVVCIGPLFDSQRGTANMLRLEEYKWCCVRKFIMGRQPAVAAWSSEVHEPLLLDCFNMMMNLVPRVRAAYNSISSSSSNDEEEEDDVLFGTSDERLAMKMLVDGCFVLRRLLKYSRMSKRSSTSSNVNDDDDRDDEWTQRLGRCWVWGTVKRDLLLLSNQVPFFVLQELYEHFNTSGDPRDLVNGGLQLLSSLHPRRQLHAAPIACKDVHHLLHLFYLSIDFPPDQEPNPPPPPPNESSVLRDPEAELTLWLPCAKELDEAGIEFIPRTTRKHGTTSFLDIRFRGGNLEIPPLQLYDYSEPLFRNLIAFEQTYPHTPGRITAYFIFMDCLLKTAEDVRLLHRSGVLVNHMNGDSADKAMEFFSRLCAEVHTSASRNYLARVMEEVTRYQRARWPRWRAALVSNYFTNPWVITSVVVAAVVLALTVLQSYYSVASYYK